MLRLCFAELLDPVGADSVDLEYSLYDDGGALVAECPGREPIRTGDEGRLFYAVEQELTIALQSLRPDLLFLHAAVLTLDGRAILLAGDSAAGKSTLAFALARHGFAYLSDELAPIALESMCVHPYPRALLLKQPPPDGYELPEATRRTARGLHVPVSALGRGRPPEDPVPLDAIFFLEPWQAGRRAPRANPVRAAEATLRLLANALNPAAHPDDGLDAAIAIAGSARCFTLSAAELHTTVELVSHELGHRTGP